MKPFFLSIATLFLGSFIGSQTKDIEDDLKSLHSTDADIRKNAARKLGGLGAKAAQAGNELVRILGDDDLLVRMEAEDALTRIGKLAVPALIIGLAEKKEEIRVRCAMILAWIGPDAAIALDALVKLMDDQEPSVRVQALIAIGQIADRRRIPLDRCEKALRDKDSYVRAAAVEVLALSEPSPKTLSLLQGALQDEAELVREKSLESLGSLGPKAKAATPRIRSIMKKRLTTEGIAAAGALALIEPKDEIAVKLLTDALVHEDDRDLRFLAAKLLGDAGPSAEGALPKLVDALKDEHPPVRYRAMIAIAQMGPLAKKELPALLTKLDDSDKSMRTLAACAIYRIDPNNERIGPVLSDCVPYLIEALESPLDPTARILVIDALSSVRGNAKEVVPALTNCLHDRIPRIRGAAQKALERMNQRPR
jgi:HEAT repeat protein